MKIVADMDEAKSRLSRLIEHMRMGDDVIIAKNGTPVARLVPVTAPGRTRPMGTYEGEIIVHDDFDAPLPDEYTGLGGTKS